jgi:hypothetical protein
LAQALEEEMLTEIAKAQGYKDAQDMVSTYSLFTDSNGHDPYCVVAVLVRVLKQRLFKGKYNNLLTQQRILTLHGAKIPIAE